MAKGQMRSNKEVRKPKADKKAKAATVSDTSKATSAFKAVDEKKKG